MNMPIGGATFRLNIFKKYFQLLHVYKDIFPKLEKQMFFSG